MLPDRFRLPVYCILLLLLCLGEHPARAYPQVPDHEQEGADIRGVVTDSTNGERILGVNVMIKGTGRGAMTNTQGFYIIPNISPGTYEIVAGAVGYVRLARKVTISGQSPVSLDFKLTTRVVEANEVVVQSEGTTSLTARSASIHIVTPRDLQRLPAVGQQDLLRSLQMLPGITSTSDVSAKFYVRGGAGDQNLILLDGMKIYNPFHAFGLFSVLDPDIVRSAEVYTGAFPAGYGGRLSSVVNVTTKDGKLSKVSGVANVNFLSGKLELDGPIAGDNSWLVSGRSSLFGSSINRLIPNPAPTTFSDLFFKGTIGTSTGRIGFRGYSSSDDVEPAASDQPNHSWRNSAYSGVLSALMTDRLYMDASVSYSSSKITRIAKPGSPVVPASSSLQEMDLKAEVTAFTDDQTTYFTGFSFEFPQIEDNIGAITPIHIKESEVEWYAWFRAEGEWGPVRYDLGVHSDIMLLSSGGPLLQGLQPRLTLSFAVGGTWIAKASYGVFTQKLITVSNEDDLISLFDAWLYLPEALRPEVARHYVLGIEGNILGPLATSLQVYAKSYPSLTVYNQAKIFPEDPDYINGTALAYGAELLLRYGSPLLDLYGSYALSKVTLTQEGFSYAPRYDRRHTIKAVATIHLFEGLDATLQWEYGSGYPFTQSAGFYDRLLLSSIGVDPFPGGTPVSTRSLGDKNAARLPAYHRLDAGITYSLLVGPFKGNLGLSVINIYDQKNILYFDRLTGRTDYMIPFFPTASLSVEF